MLRCGVCHLVVRDAVILQELLLVIKDLVKKHLVWGWPCESRKHSACLNQALWHLFSWLFQIPQLVNNIRWCEGSKQSPALYPAAFLISRDAWSSVLQSDPKYMKAEAVIIVSECSLLRVGSSVEWERECESMVQKLTLNEIVCWTHLFHTKKVLKCAITHGWQWG